ncbi:fibrinogen C domain-containing protein 1-like [Zophobas morio]|uniref:fibrinogen C domain-containing protein 1-like n=1 Tax=Zophobas morio TaxID=2755281 RepID=UPI0030837433
MCCTQLRYFIFLSLVAATIGSSEVVSTTQTPTINTEKRLRSLELQVTLLEEKLTTCPKNDLEPLHFLTTYPRDCKVYQEKGAQMNGLYRILLDPSQDSFLVFCDMHTRGGGWTYLMNRYDGSQNFDMGWNEYQEGFGNLNGEFWLGLEKMHRLTESTQISELLVELVDWDDNKVYALYNYFKIGGRNDGYRLKVVGYSGTAGDSLVGHDGQKFSTMDKDQDKHNTTHCALIDHGGWWYNSCFLSKLTGKYLKATGANYLGIHWNSFRPSNTYSLKQVRMMIRGRELWS